MTGNHKGALDASRCRGDRHPLHAAGNDRYYNAALWCVLVPPGGSFDCKKQPQHKYDCCQYGDRGSSSWACHFNHALLTVFRVVDCVLFDIPLDDKGQPLQMSAPRNLQILLFVYLKILTLDLPSCIIDNFLSTYSLLNQLFIYLTSTKQCLER